MKHYLLSALLGTVALGAAADAPLWLRDVKISPDGKQIAFTYKGDIYKVPATGGTATRLTWTPSIDMEPVWSPDGKQIAFASDSEGGKDIYIMSADGGAARRLTTNSAAETPEAFTPDGRNVVFSAAIQDNPASVMFPSGRLTELYSVPVDGGNITQILSSPAEDVSYIPGSSDFVYQDQKGMENEWRKHHTSSVTRDIWKYDAKTGRHTNLTARPGEDRNPVVSPDGKTVYFLSERDGGSFNVYSMSLDNPKDVKALTKFRKHPVRFLSQGADGTLALTYDGEIYTMRPGSQPAKVKIDIVNDDPGKIRTLSFSQGAESPVVSPDGKQIAFIHRGDLFVTSADYATTRRITSTPQGEFSPAWGDDNRTIYYTSDRDGYNTIYKATIGRDEDPNFPNATVVKEERVFGKGDMTDRMNPIVSRDGKKMAFIEDRNKIAVLDIKSGKVKRLTNGETYTARDGDIAMDWSPDGHWIAAYVDVHKRDPYYDIAIINAETGELTNITDNGYMCFNPRWVMKGDAIVFSTDRYGMRNHASWGSMNDVMIVFTNPEAYDRFRLNKEDYELYKDAEKEAKKAEKDSADKDGKKKKESAVGDSEEKEKVNVVLDGIRDRIVRLTPFSSDLGDFYVTDDGEKLYFLTSIDDGYDLWSKDLRKGDVEQVKKLGSGGLSLQPSADGKNLFLLGRNSMKKMTLPGEKLTNITFRGEMKLDPAKEREYMFDYVVAEERARFYDKNMHGVDWEAMARDYRKFLPHINNNADFAELLSELLGELNVSHTGASYYGARANDLTASLGLLYDLGHKGDGLKVVEVLTGGPFDRAKSALKSGSVITAVNGEKITPETDQSAILNRLAGKKTLVSFRDAAGEEHEEVVKPVPSATVNELLYRRWVKRNEAIVDSLSGGRLGYVHIRSMGDDSFRGVYADALGRYNERDGIVIDTRWNGGGRLHEDIEVLFSGKKYLQQEIKGVHSGDMPSRRWLKPSIMVQGEANYSNAHGTPWVYKKKGMGKLVGMPVPGTMTSVNWVDLQDDSLVFGIPVVGYRTEEGNYLENCQLEPDILVANDPATVVLGVDEQLAAAVRELLKEVAAQPRNSFADKK